MNRNRTNNRNDAASNAESNVNQEVHVHVGSEGKTPDVALDPRYGCYGQCGVLKCSRSQITCHYIEQWKKDHEPHVEFWNGN